MPKIAIRKENKLYHLLKNWSSDEKILLLYKYGVIKPHIIDWLTIYDYYNSLNEPKKNIITAVEFNISISQVKKIVNFFTERIN